MNNMAWSEFEQNTSNIDIIKLQRRKGAYIIVWKTVKKDPNGRVVEVTWHEALG